MRTVGTTKKDPVATVLCSRRFENGVEIFEQEMHQVITINGDQAAPVSAEPSLVIGDAISSATKTFIAKTRSEIAGLDALLKTLASPPLKAK